MAYDRAIFANPQIREKVLSSQRKQEEAKRVEETKKQASKAKKAAGTQISTKASPQGGKPNFEDMDAFMSNVYDEAVGAA